MRKLLFVLLALAWASSVYAVDEFEDSECKFFVIPDGSWEGYMFSDHFTNVGSYCSGATNWNAVSPGETWLAHDIYFNAASINGGCVGIGYNKNDDSTLGAVYYDQDTGIWSASVGGFDKYINPSFPYNFEDEVVELADLQQTTDNFPLVTQTTANYYIANYPDTETTCLTLTTALGRQRRVFTTH